MNRKLFGPTDSPKITIVGGIHGDEPLTGAVILYLKRTLQETQLSGDVQIELIVANEEALAENKRYIDVDLNRQIKTNKHLDKHEIHLAEQLESHLDSSMSILALHSSKSVPPPFAIAGDIQNNAELLTALPYTNAVKDTGSGTIEAEYKSAVNVELGHQQTNQVFYNGIIAVNIFLTYHRATNRPLTNINHTDTTVYEVTKALPKSHGTPKTYYSNFDTVPEGETIAEDDGLTHTANTDDVPILLSENGYQDQFGLLGCQTKTLTSP